MSKENSCPWCGEEVQDLWEYNIRDGDAEEFDCPSCGKKIEISLCISHDYTIKAAGCQKHHLGLHKNMHYYSGLKFVEFECTECKNEFYDHDLPPPLGKYGNIKEGCFELTPEAEERLKAVTAARVLNK